MTMSPALLKHVQKPGSKYPPISVNEALARAFDKEADKLIVQCYRLRRKADALERVKLSLQKEVESLHPGYYSQWL